jgi:membrane complex biogenesis BtpA family protein
MSLGSEVKRPRTGAFRELFSSRKPVIAMAHLPALPGSALYDDQRGMSGIVEAVRADVEILLAHDVDAIMFCNEGDRPYTLKAGPEGVAALARVVTELAPTDRPFGVDFLWDPEAALAVAVACGANFIREVVTGVYESDMGLWNTNASRLLRERRRLHGEDVAVLMNVTPEFASPIGRRSIADAARSAAFSSLADAVLVSGSMAGVEPGLDALVEAKGAVGDVPVLVNTGAKSTNIAASLDVVDGVIVGSDLKFEGDTWSPVDPDRVARFLEAARG